MLFANRSRDFIELVYKWSSSSYFDWSSPRVVVMLVKAFIISTFNCY